MFGIILLIQAFLILFVTGILYGFSDFIMKALNKLPATSAIDAMNSINVSVYKSLFMVLFMLLPIASLGTMAASVFMYGWSGSVMVLIAGFAYIVGMFMVTGRGSVPLNNALRDSHTGHNPTQIWQKYYTQWTRLNTIRCFFGFMSSVLLTVAAYMLLA